jgi:uncharacterized protein with HEPN domain
VLHEHDGDRIRHMIQRIDWIHEMVGEMSREAFAEDLKTQLAVQASFAQLGEASMRVSEVVREEHPEIEWKAIRHFRNFMIHVYDQIDPNKLFDTSARDLLPLREKLCRVLDQDAADG